MKRFDFLRPATPEEAFAALQQGGTCIAGGTNLLDLMKTGVKSPERLVDISGLPGLDRIDTLADGSLRIGALVRNADAARDPAVTGFAPMLAEALLSGASAQLRNAATMGGNILQRPRCAWFFDPGAECGRRTPGAGCAAQGQEVREAAVLGWSGRCIAVNPSDLSVALAALGAVVELTGPEGTRLVPFTAFQRLPGDSPEREFEIAADELVMALRLPADAAACAGNSRYIKMRERTSYAFALVSAAAGLSMTEGRITAAQLALGGVAARPWRVAAAEEALIGAVPRREAFAEAVSLLLEGAAPSAGNGFKIELAGRVAMRALQAAAEGTPERMPALPGSVFAAENPRAEISQEHRHG